MGCGFSWSLSGPTSLSVTSGDDQELCNHRPHDGGVDSWSFLGEVGDASNALHVTIAWGDSPPTAGRIYRLPGDANLYGYPKVNVSPSYWKPVSFTSKNAGSSVTLQAEVLNDYGGGQFRILIREGSLVASTDGEALGIAGEISGTFVY